MKKHEYIHGYEPVEQARLIEQARAMERWVFEGVAFKPGARVLEVGCGVGAQTKILLKRFPDITIDALDLSPEQLEAARHYLKRELKQGRVRLMRADASDLSALEARAYDGAFICWFLEHVKEPVQVLQQTRARLKRGAPVFVNEVFNQALFIEPYSPAFLKYWFEFNDHQWESGGHPFVGASLGNLLTGAGFRRVETALRPVHFDSRRPRERARFTEYQKKELLSAAPALLKAGRVDRQTVAKLKREFARVERGADAVFFAAWMHATGQA